MTVYVDLLLLTNLYVNYLLLTAAARLARVSFGRGRRLAAAMLGALASLLMLAPPLPWYALAPIRFALAGVLVFVAGGERRLRPLLRQTLLFFGSSAALAGALLLVWTFWLPDFVAVANGAVYFDISAVTLLLTTTAAYAALWLLARLRSHTPSGARCRARLTTSAGQVELRGLVDTGNRLRDVFTDAPVAVVRYRAVERALPDAVRDDVRRLVVERLPVTAWTPNPRLRLIPGTTVAGGALLPAFEPLLLELRPEELPAGTEPPRLLTRAEPNRDAAAEPSAPRAGRGNAAPEWKPAGRIWIAVCADDALPDVDLLVGDLGDVCAPREPVRKA